MSWAQNLPDKVGIVYHSFRSLSAQRYRIPLYMANSYQGNVGPVEVFRNVDHGTGLVVVAGHSPTHRFGIFLIMIFWSLTSQNIQNGFCHSDPRWYSLYGIQLDMNDRRKMLTRTDLDYPEESE